MRRLISRVSLRPFNPLRWSRRHKIFCVGFTLFSAILFALANRFIFDKQLHWAAAPAIGAIFGLFLSYFQIAEDESMEPPSDLY